MEILSFKAFEMLKIIDQVEYVDRNIWSAHFCLSDGTYFESAPKIEKVKKFRAFLCISDSLRLVDAQKKCFLVKII